MPAFVITADRSIQRYAKASIARKQLASLKAQDATDEKAGLPVYVVAADDLLTVSSGALVDIYNEAARRGEGKEINKFASKESAANRTFPCLDFLAVDGPEPTAVAAAPKAAKAAKAPKAEGEKSGRRGRASKYAGKKIRILTEGKVNPRREGTGGHTSFQLYRDGMLYEDYIAAGGAGNHFQWDLDHGYIAAE